MTDKPKEGTETIEGSSSLEDFKKHPDSPFETVDKNEEPPEYPYVFQNKLKASWSKVCDLMDWKKANSSIDWNFFRVSKNPFEVVTKFKKKYWQKVVTLRFTELMANLDQKPKEH